MESSGQMEETEKTSKKRTFLAIGILEVLMPGLPRLKAPVTTHYVCVTWGVHSASQFLRMSNGVTNSTSFVRLLQG